MKIPELSIVILNYKTKDITEACIHSIYKETKQVSFEIIVVDNNSADDSLSMLKKEEEKGNIVLIANKENVGFCKGNNQGVKQAKGAYILLLNSDTVILDGAIDKLFTHYRLHEDTIHFLGPQLLNTDGSLQPSCGPSFNLWYSFLALFLKGDSWGGSRKPVTKDEFVGWMSGACILTKKEYYNTIGGFDETVFMYMDEIDLLYRAREHGYTVAVTPRAKITHIGSASSNKTYPVLQVYRGYLFLYKKHYSPLELKILKIMLQLKAAIALAIGFATGNTYLKQTYMQALQIVKRG